MPRVLVASDDFNRANESPLSDGGKWSTNTLPSGGGPCILDTNRVQGQGVGGNLKLSERSSETFLSNQYSRIIVSALPINAGASGSVGAYVRGTGLSLNNNFYLEHLRALTPFTRIMRCDNGLLSTLVTSDAVTFAIGDELVLEVDATTLRLYKNGVEQLTTVDATYSSGKPGICAHSPDGLSIGELDSWQGGNLSISSSGAFSGFTQRRTNIRRRPRGKPPLRYSLRVRV